MKNTSVKKLIRTSVFYLFVTLLLSDCASVQPPPGGPKDEDPPILIGTVPKTGSINYKSRSIELIFNESVQLDNIFRQLIIAPYSDIRYVTKIKKNVVTLEFDEDLEENTTYSLNFRESVVDVTEKNIAKNVKVAFSTGDYIDSLKIEGNVSELFSGKPSEEATVMLLREEDTLNVQKPYYLAKTDEEGNYLLENIREGIYQIYAVFEDDNNLQYTGEEKELFGFKADNITLDSNLIDMDFQLAKYDIEDIFFKRTGVDAQYAEIEYNKKIESYEFELLDEDMKDSVYHILNENMIKLYKLKDPADTVIELSRSERKKERKKEAEIENNPEAAADSLTAIIIAYDELGQSSTDTVKFTFSERRSVDPEPLSVSISPKNGGKMIPEETFDVDITFNKPALKFDPDKINILRTRDTTLYNLDTMYYVLQADTLLLEVDSTLLIPIKEIQDENEEEGKIEPVPVESDTLELVYNKELKFDYSILGDKIDLIIKPKATDRDKSITQVSANADTVIYAINILNLNSFTLDTTYYETEVTDTLPNPYELETLPNFSKITIKDYLPADREAILLDSLAFLSVEYDTLKGEKASYKLKNIDDYGSIEGRVETDFTSFFVQLLNDKFEVEQELVNQKEFRFDYVEPGTKYLRLQVDNNNDGVWDKGNFRERRPAEDVYFSEKGGIDVKPNWEILGELISTKKKKTKK
ncbi:Ig-like domain-containing protein [Flammeovirgaceae bacterium SG7u.111]|nr:Ig-like domain-containing protein [Flammeovirgaceae bacterium SG7u.132]WPO35513.1 Ig-like domain-containing protein [Flammeovirgaceae bacterium SG7u.111]